MKYNIKTKKNKHKFNTSHRINKGSTIKMFNLDLHASVIEDVKTIVKRLYNNKIEITEWSISGASKYHNKESAEVKHINQDTWKNINIDLIKQFQDEYDSILKDYDVFIVTHTPVFIMLYEKYNKPIIVVNSCRYDQPFCWNKNSEMEKLFHESLKRMQNSGQMTIISNNKADQRYLKEGAGIDSIYIPSICMYTDAKYNKEHATYLLFENNIKDKFKSVPNSDIIVDRPENYTYADLFKYSGIIHMPYDISSMSLFEQYFAGMPLFFPSKHFYKECIQNSTVKFRVRYDKPDEIISSDEIDLWLKDADYYKFKYIYYYDSFKDCVDKVKDFRDLDKNKRLKWVNSVKQKVLKRWQRIFTNIIKGIALAAQNE